MAKSSEYWKKRFEQIEQSQNQQGVQCYAEIEKQYRQAQKQLEGQIASWYQRFATNNKITLAEAHRLLTSDELAEFKWDVNQYIQYGEENAINGTWCKQLENASARFHINRLEALKIQTQQAVEVLFGNQLDTIDDAMKGIYTSGYYHTAFEIQKGVGVGWDFATLDDKQISKVINKPWSPDGKNFSERVWTNRQKLVNELNTTLTQNIVLGKDPQKAIDEISRKMKTSKNVAGRLVMTEEAAFSSAAQKDCFTELDVEQFEIVATLDSHTSEICQGMDSEHFPMSQYEVGVTAPPFHVYCRSTTVPYFDDEFDAVGERAAKGEDGKTYYVPSTMKYPDWKKSFVDGDKSGLQEVKPDDTMKVKVEQTDLQNAIKELPTLDKITNATDRVNLAEQFINSLGIEYDNVDFNSKLNTSYFGACSFVPGSENCNYNTFILKQNDKRKMNYGVKTAFHESYHFSLQGQEWDAVSNGKINPKWLEIEETFAESAAHHAAKLYGITDIAPSYSERLVRVLPRMKQLSHYADCKTISDFGKLAWTDRLSGNSGVWLDLYDSVFSVNFDAKNYYSKYFSYMKDNTDELLDKMLENMPEFTKYKQNMTTEFNTAMKFVEDGGSVSDLKNNESMIFNNILIIAMDRKGI